MRQLRTQCRQPTQRGISLLEMLVALTILATSAAVLFDWLYQVNLRLRTLNAQQAQTTAQLRAVEYLNAVNPLANPNGRQAFDGFELEWRAKASTPLRSALDPNDGPLRTELAVFTVHAQITREGDTKPWVEFDTRLPGWNKLPGGALANVIGIAGSQ